MRISLGFSPCPNDTFIFDALVNKKIDTGNYQFDIYLEDVQTLNQWVIEGKLDLSKISYGVLPLVLDQYILLKAGGALGKGVGPLLISKQQISSAEEIINHKTVAIPGINTTAHLLFSLAYPQAMKKSFALFSAIENMVVKGESDLGVIIHENRFTYQEKGLKKVVDLGEFWEKETGLPIPLGGIVAKRNLNRNILNEIDGLIKQSISFAFNNYPNIADYVKTHAQEMSEKVMRQHIDLYVNDFSLDLGDQGKAAVKKLLEVYSGIHAESISKHQIFL